MLGAGFAKATSPKAKLAENPRMAWTEDFSTQVVDWLLAHPKP